MALINIETVAMKNCYWFILCFTFCWNDNIMVEYGAFGHKIDVIIFKEILNLEGHQNCIQTLRQFCWMRGSCLLVELQQWRVCVCSLRSRLVSSCLTQNMWLFCVTFAFFPAIFIYLCFDYKRKSSWRISVLECHQCSAIWIPKESRLKCLLRLSKI